jgi:rubrerythrin
MVNTVQYVQSNQIVELMRQPTEQRDATWLREAVQQAILLELATLPPYLCGMWSIDPPGGNNQVSRTLRTIIFDEMSHLGIACNLLTTIGGTPGSPARRWCRRTPARCPAGYDPISRSSSAG